MVTKTKKQKNFVFGSKPEMVSGQAPKKLPNSKAPGKTVSKSKLRPGKKRYAAQGGKPNVT